jgi:ATP-dependent DNA helicase RecG
VDIHDESGRLLLRFFHFSPALQKRLTRGTRIRCFGEVRQGPIALEVIHPEIQILTDVPTPTVDQHLTPVYPTTEGLHQIYLRNLSDQALAWLKQANQELTDWLPETYLPDPIDCELKAALHYIHRPPPDADVDLLQNARHPAQQRLAFEELLAQQLSLVRLRTQVRQLSAYRLPSAGRLFERLQSQLPFSLTAAQRRVIEEITQDLATPYPMQRLVQGDVGSGKTIVAAAACLQAVEAGYQAAIMAPTELLAEQHFHSYTQWFTPLNLSVVRLTGKQKPLVRKASLEMINSGEAAVVIGTHALFQEGVNFNRLALVVIDEQHRFGVHQRLALRAKGLQQGTYPHQLIMTATPIPRTLAMTAYADLDYSVIDELPPGRSPVKTVALPNSRRQTVIERVSHACERGRQAYWVCTLIEESEALQCQAAEDTATLLINSLPHLKIGLIHGRMQTQEKETIMSRFKAGEIQLLIATTVIEVGMDVPNASLMIIENPERLGLAQLHQLRGRVGRGSLESSCVLLYQSPLSDSARRRLQTLRQTNDGFEIAKADLELRGPGEVLGTRQTGMLQMRLANLVRDQALLPLVQTTAKKLIANYPENVEPLILRWLGDSAHYGQV